jgi:hypothetical protein
MHINIFQLRTLGRNVYFMGGQNGWVQKVAKGDDFLCDMAKQQCLAQGLDNAKCL